MQRDTTPASSKVGAPVFKLIVVFAETTTLPLHKTKNKTPPKLPPWKKSQCSYAWRWSPKANGVLGASGRGIQGMLCVPSERKQARATLFPLVLADDTMSSIWSPACPCHVPASALHSHADSTGPLEIRGRCELMQCIETHLATGKMIWRLRDNKEWWAADGVSLRIKSILIRNAVRVLSTAIRMKTAQRWEA